MSCIGEFAHTDKQAEIMRHILGRADEGVYLTLAELREKLSYKPSKQAILCSINFLVKWGFVTKQPHGNRSMDLIPTTLAYSVFRNMPTTA